MKYFPLKPGTQDQKGNSELETVVLCFRLLILI